jgi:AraC family transcriptional regulator
LQPLDRIVFETKSVRAGTFNCPPFDSRFRDSGPTHNALVVFPRTAVRLRYAGSREFVSDPTISTIYNRGQEYTRGKLSADGDRCDWFGVAPAVALEIAAGLDPRTYDHPDRPFAREWTPVDSALYLAQRTLFSRLARGDFDPLEAEQSIIEICAAVLRRAYSATPSIATSRPRADEAHRDLAQRARAFLLATVNDRVTLAMLSSELGVSEFHLCRVFRQQTGMTLHDYRTELRLRKALEMLPSSKSDISRIALELGFSSHSHFTDAVRRGFGRTPTELRKALN